MPGSGNVVSLSFEQSDIAVLSIDDPNKGANVLSRFVLAELENHLNTLQSRQDVAGLIIRSGKVASFVAGADLREFAAEINSSRETVMELCRRGQHLFGRLAELPFVTIAAIDGICVGGGAELSVWCDRRVLTDDPKTQIGFPEVKLGLFPGWGGTSRTPRMVGLGNAVEMVTSGEPIDAKAAAAMGLASDVVPRDRLLEAAIELARFEQKSGQFLRDRQKWSGAIAINETELGFLGATASAYIQQQTAGKYPAPMAALEVMLGAVESDLAGALEMEAAGMADLFGSPVNRALLNVFFLTDRNKKDPGVDRTDVTTQPIKSVGVIGAGIMGIGIAAANVRRDVPVTITDASQPALARGIQQIIEEVAYNKVTKGPDIERAVQYAPLVNPATADAELATCDLVVEAVIEKADVKKSVYARLEPLLRNGAILSSNTSTIPITQLAAGLQRPDRFCGIHFFNPVRRMALVEVIRGQKTSDETIASAVAYAKSIGKSPIVVGDGPGFLVNRLLLPYMNEALELISEGAEIKAIERAAKDFGMPMGPLTLYDVVGIDTAFYAGRVMWEAFPDRIAASPILPALMKAGRLGQKSGSGFFIYKDKKGGRGQPDPKLSDVIKNYIMKRNTFTAEEITNRLFLPMVLEATRILSDKLVRDVRDVDLGMIFGLGFPAFRGGLLFWADTLGAAKIVEMLKPLAHLGERARPTPMLLDMARSGRRFYDNAEPSVSLLPRNSQPAAA